MQDIDKAEKQKKYKKQSSNIGHGAGTKAAHGGIRKS